MAHGEEYESALKYLEEAERAGRNVDRELGRTYLRSGQLDKAKPRLERAVAKAAEDYNVLADLAELSYQLESYDASVELYRKANGLHPYDLRLKQNLGRALDKTGRTGAGYYYFGEAAEISGDARQALIYYEKAAEDLDHDDPLSAPVAKKIAMLEQVLARPVMPRINRGR